ncbi:glycoside hydrolase family 16 protein [Streptomyces ossamyceticus]|uniref:Glycoside hydrolase family 16 protein n=1 Tax=Streptomyces ossamyceticus TaxID=249581 RepID=A0ABV2V841_9ACTN
MTARRAMLGVLLLLLVTCGCGSTTRAVPEPKPSVPGDWHLEFHDDFDGSRLDRKRWTTCYDWNDDGCTIGSSGELEWYQPGQVSVDGGKLTLAAERRTVRGSDGQVHPWVSGMISTGRDDWYAEPRETFTYGYFEAAIRIPAQSGMAPAFWLIPASRFTPPEIDIMEFLGAPDELTMYVHWRNAEGDERKQRGAFAAPGFPDNYHVFALLWEKDRLVWYVDGVERFRVTAPERIPHVPMEVILNLAVGLLKPPPPSTDSARMLVDWVRVWQR